MNQKNGSTLTDEVQQAAEEQAAQDAALMAMLQSQNRQQTAAGNRRITLGESYVEATELIVTARKETRLSEATLVKLWELTLMWQLNNRQQVSTDVYPPEMDEAGPTPHEVITEEV